MLSAPYKWLVLEGSSNEGFFEYPGVDSDVLIWHFETGGLTSVYRRSKNGELVVEDRGTWISGRLDLQGVDKNALSRRRKNLGGIEFKSSLVV